MASKPVNVAFIEGLEVLENETYPLQGVTGVRSGKDSRLANFVGAGMPQGNTVCYYEHMTTIRHTPILFQNGVDHAHPRPQSRALHRLLPLIARRYRVAQPPVSHEPRRSRNSS
jgi:hypothetical protein